MGVALQSSYTDKPAFAFPGTLGAGPHFKLPGKNTEASASIPFGTAVAFKPAPTTDIDVYLPAAGTDKIKGILYRSDSYARSWTDDAGTHGELDSTGVLPGVIMDLLVSGLIWVTCEDGCNVNDHLFVRYAGGTKGALRSTDAGGSTCLDCTTQGQWLSKASAASGAWLKANFSNK
jgi:hypothetical protein